MKVKQLIEELSKCQPEAEIVSSEFIEEHDEYDVKQCEFCVARYYNNIDDDVGVVYVGPMYMHPN